jgi:hypothetical protein
MQFNPQPRKVSTNLTKLPLTKKEPKVDQPAGKSINTPSNLLAGVASTRPKNPSAITVPTEGYVLEIDGKFKSEYRTSEDAMKSGTELKKKYPFIHVVVYGAKERTRTLVKLDQPSNKTEAAI